MVSKRFTYDEYLPDLPRTLGGGKNAWPMASGYRPVNAFSAITPALSGLLGGAAYVSSSGTASLLAGTATDLYRYSGTAWGSILDSLTATIWRFDQFGDLVVAVNGGAPVKADLGGTADVLGGDPPTSDLVATVRQQVFLAGDPSARNTVAISGYNDSEGWTAGDNQCLFVPFPTGGDIMGLCGGETGLILQKHSVKRATYTGDVTVWQFDEIASDVGCMAKGSVAQAGQLVFFLSEQGFKVCDRNTVTPIGQEKVDRTFFSRYSRGDIDKISAAVDPRTTTVSWAMPGNPGDIWHYNWALGKWGLPIETPLSTVFSGFTANVGIDALASLYPLIDDVPYPIDAQIFRGGNPLFLVADNSGAIGALSGPNMAAQFVLKPDEPVVGSRIRIRGARAVCDATTGTVTIDARARAGDAPTSIISGAIREDGRVPLRANGRHIGITHAVPAAEQWTYAAGIDLEYEAAGGR